MNGFDAFQVQSLKHASPFSPGAASAAANAPAACLPLVENFHHDQVMTSETLGPPNQTGLYRCRIRPGRPG